MNSFEFGQMAYLVLLGIAVGGWFISQNRNSLGKIAQQMLVWGLIFVGVVAAAGLWSDIRDDVAPRQSIVGSGVVEVPRDASGHYNLVLQLDGKPVNFLIDTGATDVVLTQSDAARVGINLNDLVYSGTANTANGVVRTAQARVNNVQLGDLVDRDLRVSVTQGDMDGSLLGMSYLQRFRKIEITGNTMTLSR